jgi:hypothetical protein
MRGEALRGEAMRDEAVRGAACMSSEEEQGGNLNSLSFHAPKLSPESKTKLNS